MGHWRDLSVDNYPRRCYLALPQAAQSPGVLVCMHGPGVDEFIQDICERLAAHGVVALAPDLYHRQPEPRVEPWTKIKDTEALQDMAQAFTELQALAEVAPARVGVLGFCMGGRLAFLHAANNPALRTAVIFHGGNLLVAREGLPSPFEQAKNIQAPVLGLFGADDQNPSPADAQKLETELTRLGKAHAFHSYAGAGHAFLNFTRPAAFREAQAQAAWATCLAWLDQYL